MTEPTKPTTGRWDYLPAEAITPAATPAAPEAAPNGTKQGGPKGGKKSAKKGGTGGGKKGDQKAPPGNGGLRGPQVRVLEALARLDQGEALNKAELSERAPVHENWVPVFVGRLDKKAGVGELQKKTSRHGLDTDKRLGIPSLLTLGLVQGLLRESRAAGAGDAGGEGKAKVEEAWAITPAGRKALARARAQGKEARS
jgi:hypothetical protein